MKKITAMLLALMLALSLAACTQAPVETTPTDPTEATEAVETPDLDVTVLGEGETVFAFTVVELDGKETAYEIHTNETTVGAALLALGLLEGEDGPYGLYVTAVNGIVADYNVDQTYWAFYVNGEYGLTGVDVTDIVPGTAYSFVQTKG